MDTYAHEDLNGVVDIENKSIALMTKFLSKYGEEGLYIDKLYKLLFYFDFICVKENRKTFTGDVYYKSHYGAVPSIIKNECELLLSKGGLRNSLSKDFYSLNHDVIHYFSENHRGVAKGNVFLDGKRMVFDYEKYFSSRENEIFDIVHETFKKVSPREMLEISNNEYALIVGRPMHVISYALAFDKDFPIAVDIT